MTVTGPVEAADLGVTLPHEHVFLDLTREYRGNGLLNDAALAESELQRYLDAGGRTLVDVTTGGLADVIVRDIEEGTDGVRAGIIGEIGCDRFVSALEERSFRAAARAHRRTGLTITTHAARWPVGTAQLDLLVEEGVDPSRVVIGHCDMVPDHDYHLTLARRGAWVQFDTVQSG